MGETQHLYPCSLESTPLAHLGLLRHHDGQLLPGGTRLDCARQDCGAVLASWRPGALLLQAAGGAAPGRPCPGSEARPRQCTAAARSCTTFGVRDRRHAERGCSCYGAHAFGSEDPIGARHSISAPDDETLVHSRLPGLVRPAPSSPLAGLALAGPAGIVLCAPPTAGGRPVVRAVGAGGLTPAAPWRPRATSHGRRGGVNCGGLASGRLQRGGDELPAYDWSLTKVAMAGKAFWPRCA
jgi:hypothetical protein